MFDPITCGAMLAGMHQKGSGSRARGLRVGVGSPGGISGLQEVDRLGDVPAPDLGCRFERDYLRRVHTEDQRVILAPANSARLRRSIAPSNPLGARDSCPRTAIVVEDLPSSGFGAS